MTNQLSVPPALLIDGTSMSGDLSRVLTPEDRDTLAHLLKRGIGENSLRATRSDLAYLEAWSLACEGEQLEWPPARETVLSFIAHHLWDPDEKSVNPSHGMPAHVREALERGKYLRSTGPHAPSTVERRLSTWRSMCKWRGLDHPFTHPEVAKTLRAAIRSSGKPRTRKSRKNVDIDLITELLDHLDGYCVLHHFDNVEDEAIRLRAFRDRALLAVMFASGGRRRSEISNLMCGQIFDLEPIPTEDKDWPNGIPSMGLLLGRTKTTDDRDGGSVFLSGRAAVALGDWQTAVSMTSGPVFLRIGRWGKIYDSAISPHSVNHVLKRRLGEIGLDPRDFSAHGVRAGYITSALKSGIPAPEIMEQTLHKSLDTLLGYFKDEQQRQGRAARLL